MVIKSLSCACKRWQNIRKYDNVTGAFFMFDENKINGKGAWAKSFLKITKNNE